MSNFYRVGVKADKKNSLPEKVIIPTRQGKVIAIADEGFLNCKTIKEIVLPENTKFMGANAFSGCDNLDTISINKTLAEVNELNWPAGWNGSATVDYKPAVTYSVSVSSFNGSVSGLNTDRKYEANAVVSFTVSVNSGYELISVAYNGTTLTANAEGGYSFLMPAKNVTITVITQADEPITPPVEPDTTETISYYTTTNWDQEKFGLQEVKRDLTQLEWESVDGASGSYNNGYKFVVTFKDENGEDTTGICAVLLPGVWDEDTTCIETPNLEGNWESTTNDFSFGEEAVTWLTKNYGYDTDLFNKENYTLICNNTYSATGGISYAYRFYKESK